jgi:hypothetical protein
MLLFFFNYCNSACTLEDSPRRSSLNWDSKGPESHIQLGNLGSFHPSLPSFCVSGFGAFCEFPHFFHGQGSFPWIGFFLKNMNFFLFFLVHVFCLPYSLETGKQKFLRSTVEISWSFGYSFLSVCYECILPSLDSVESERYDHLGIQHHSQVQLQ